MEVDQKNMSLAELVAKDSGKNKKPRSFAPRGRGGAWRGARGGIRGGMRGRPTERRGPVQQPRKRFNDKFDDKR